MTDVTQLFESRTRNGREVLAVRSYPDNCAHCQVLADLAGQKGDAINTESYTYNADGKFSVGAEGPIDLILR